jgi:hypothetical protein
VLRSLRSNFYANNGQEQILKFFRDIPEDSVQKKVRNRQKDFHMKISRVVLLGVKLQVILTQQLQHIDPSVYRGKGGVIPVATRWSVLLATLHPESKSKSVKGGIGFIRRRHQFFK